jgi:hypothetical protein
MKVFGLDVGRHFDQSVLIGLSDKRISPITLLHGMDFIAQGKFLKEGVGNSPIYVDVTGLGRGLADILERLHKMMVVPVVIGSGDTVKPHRDGFWVGKQLLISMVNMSLDKFQIGPTVSQEVRTEFRRQLSGIIVKPGKVARFEGKSGVHDDLVIAYGLALLGGYLSGRKEVRIPDGATVGPGPEPGTDQTPGDRRAEAGATAG